MQATGRFAPSPTGDLHFGSLVAALASFLQAQSNGGRWLVRVEDIDPPREVPGSAGRILADLNRFGMQSDEPVLYQSSRTRAYETAIKDLLDQGRAFWCGCSRSDLPANGIYPGTCRNGLPAGKRPRSVRLRAGHEVIRFDDRIQGTIEEELHRSVGDFVILRADGQAAYQLAVVMDDAFQGVTEVVRGADLLDSTARQIYLQGCLGLPTPAYTHHPVAVTGEGKKLSKRLGSDPLATAAPDRVLTAALRFLGQPCPDGLSIGAALDWALANWRLSAVPRAGEVIFDPLAVR